MNWEKQREIERRKRINRMKKTIVYIAIVLILIPIIMCFVLFSKVNRLEDKLDDLLQSIQTGELVVQKEEKGIRLVYANSGDTSSEKKETEKNSSSKDKTTEKTDTQKNATKNTEKGTSEDTVNEQSKTSAETMNEETLTEENTRPDTCVTTSYVKKEGKVAYLTFDDGPSSRTEQIIKILKKKNVKATFFVVGKTDEESLVRYKKIADAGHTIAMHSFSHDYEYIYDSVENFEKDMKKLQNILYDATGTIPTIFRFPGGSSTSMCEDIEQYIQFANENGLTYFDWNVSAEDAIAGGSTADEIAQNVVNGALQYDTSVILMHDAEDKKTTVDALPKIIDSLKENGYNIEAIDETVEPVQHVKADKVKK